MVGELQTCPLESISANLKGPERPSPIRATTDERGRNAGSVKNLGENYCPWFTAGDGRTRGQDKARVM